MASPAVLLLLALGGGPARDFGPLYALAQQLEQDYVEAVETHEAPLMDKQAEVARHAVEVARALRAPALVVEVQKLEQGITRHVEAIELRDTFRKLEQLLDAAGGFPRAPATSPDLQRAAKAFSTTCATCHGATGGGDGPAAAALSPRPESFLSADVANPMSPWRAFVAITYGVHGTAMVAFTALSDAERWSLAFYVLTLRQPACTGKGVKLSLRERATSTDLQLSGRFGEAALACLRRKLEQ